jgi:hypothetical protein
VLTHKASKSLNIDGEFAGKNKLGDAGGPLLAITLTPALLAFAGLLTATAGIVAAPNRRAPHPANADPCA